MESSSSPRVVAFSTPLGREPASLLDLAAGVSASAVARADHLGRRLGRAAKPVAGLVLRPPMLTPRYQPQTWLAGLSRRGARQVEEARQRIVQALDVLVPVVAAELLRRVDLTALVKRYVDLDELVADVDLDAAARRLDIDAVVDRLDLTRIVRERVDLDLLVSTVDLDAAAARLDVDAVAARLDLDAVIARIDLAGLAAEVIAEVDLPGIIRESTGSVASDAVRGVRMQGVSGDEAVSRAVDRLRLRRGRRGEPVATSDAPVRVEGVPRQPGPGATGAP